MLNFSSRNGRGPGNDSQRPSGLHQRIRSSFVLRVFLPSLLSALDQRGVVARQATGSRWFVRCSSTKFGRREACDRE